MTGNRNMQAYGFLIITTFCFGMNANFGKLAVGEISPMVMVLLRWVGTVLLMTVFFRKRLLREWPVLRRHWPYLAAMGVLGLTAFNALFYVAAHTTSALNMGILQGAIPMFVLLGAFVFFKAPMHPLQILGVVVTVVGVIVATVSGDLERLAALAFQPGDVLMIIACVLYASYSLLLRRCPAVDPLALFSVFAIGALVAALPLPIAEAAMGHLQWPTTKGWILVVLVVLFPSFLAQVFFIKGVSLIGPERAGVFFNLIPIFAAMVAVAFLGERFYAYHALALGLVLGGIGLSEWSKRREH